MILLLIKTLKRIVFHIIEIDDCINRFEFKIALIILLTLSASFVSKAYAMMRRIAWKSRIWFSANIRDALHRQLSPIYNRKQLL